MRYFLTYHLLPLCFSLLLLFFTCKYCNVHSFLSTNVHEEVVSAPKNLSGYYENYKSGWQAEYDLCNGLVNKSIIVIGSSELTEGSNALPYRFIPEKTGYPTLGIGHAGNQCLCILTQLAALHDYLKDSKIVIIVSPGWFSTEGASLESFLEFNNDRFLVNGLNNPQVPLFVKGHICEYVKNHFQDITSPSTILRLMNSLARSDKNKIQNIIYAPVRKSNEMLLKSETEFRNSVFNEHQPQYKFQLPEVRTNQSANSGVDHNINWTVLYQTAIDSEKVNTTSNEWGIYNDYYSKYINGKHSSVEIVKEADNHEWNDFKILVAYLRLSNVNASFIIQPLNPYYYKNLNEINPLVLKIENEIHRNDFQCLNLFVDDTAKYEKPLLKDVMHLDDYGWYKMDQFIIDNYLKNE